MMITVETNTMLNVVTTSTFVVMSTTNVVTVLTLVIQTTEVFHMNSIVTIL